MNDATSSTPLPISEPDTAKEDTEKLVSFFERSLGTWAQDQEVTLAVGNWQDGAVMELVGVTQMLSARYEGCFNGVRELRTSDSEHHVHIDLARIHSIEYVIAPSVCLEFRPSLEIRYLCIGPGGARTGRAMLRALFASPYTTTGVDGQAVAKWYQRYKQDVTEKPDRVRLIFDSKLEEAKEGCAILEALATSSQKVLSNWSSATKELTFLERPATVPSGPAFHSLVEEAIAIPEASLVIYRDRTLVEFKTDHLGGLFEYREGDHISWQFGRFEGHHCHLSLNAVTGIEFSAEPVSCQKGRLNYTIWFLIAGGCGNPFRSDGYFSVTLNRPYKGDHPRWEVICPLVNIYAKYRHQEWVRADNGFIAALRDVPQGKGLTLD